MKEIEIKENDNIESIVYTLLAARARGEHVYCIINDIRLDSDTVTMDHAYLLLTGHTKEEFDKEVDKNVNKMLEEEEVLEGLWGFDLDQVVDKLLELKNQGRHVSYKFNDTVLHSDNVTLDSAYLDVTGYTKEEYDRIVDKLLNEDEIELEGSLDDKLYEVVDKLIEYRNQGKRARYDFNGVILHSDDVTMDSAYLDVTGYTKEESDKKLKEEEENFDKQMEEEYAQAEDSKEEWIREGYELIYPERQDAWNNYVNEHVKSIFAGSEIRESLKLMKLLEEGAPIIEVRRAMNDQNYSGYALELIRKSILVFSKRGPEFYKQTAYKELTEDEIEILNQITMENIQYADNEKQRMAK